jgi:hypothetical protein
MRSYSDKLAAIVRSCILANPAIGGRVCGKDREVEELPTRIRLTDVKWVIMTTARVSTMETDILALDCWWNLEKDALGAQSDECVGFLFDCLQRSAFRGR